MLQCYFTYLEDAMGKLSITLDERIKRKTADPDENGCMRWLGTKAKSGHPVLSLNNETKQVRRLAYELAHGPLPSPRLFVLPRCGVVDCINPEHLFLASRAHEVNNLAPSAPAMPVEYQPRMITAAGQTKTLEQWLDDHLVKVTRPTLLARLRDIEWREEMRNKYGRTDIRESYWTPEKALFTPAQPRSSKPRGKPLPIGPSILQVIGQKRKKLNEGK